MRGKRCFDCHETRLFAKAGKAAAEALAVDPLFLDTETTGLDDDAEIVEIAILDSAGKILLQSLCRPSKPMSEAAAAVNQINPVELDTAPTWPAIADHVCRILKGRFVVCHNASYDARLVRQTCRIHGTPDPEPAGWGCSLEMLTQANGGRWPRLTRAMELTGAEYPDAGAAHRAAYDAECVRRILFALESQR
jgi:DNA polymerase-3 subunit epsilon